MILTIDSEAAKVIGPALLYLGGLALTVKTLKKQVNGIGTKLRALEVQNARIEVAVGLHPIAALAKPSPDAPPEVKPIPK